MPLRFNVITHLYVVHAVVNGKRTKVKVSAESEMNAEMKALSLLKRDYDGEDIDVDRAERIDSEDDL